MTGLDEAAPAKRETATPAGGLRRWTPRRLDIALGVAAALATAAPLLVVAARLAIQQPSIPLAGDQAVIQLSAVNGGHHAQLLGPYSRYGWHHPGPSWFYLLDALFLPFGSHGWSLIVAVLAVEAVTAVAIVVVVWRRVGATGALLTALLLLAFFHAFGAERLLVPWNPYAIVLPTALLLLLAGAPAEGSMAGLAGLLVVGSFLVQTHVGTLPAVLAIGAVAVILALVHRRALRAREPVWLTWRTASVPTWRGRLTLAGSVLLALLVGLMWAPPVVEQLTDQPGNLRSLVHFFRTAHADHTLREGVDAVGAQLTAFPFGAEQDTLPAFAGGTGAHALMLAAYVVLAVVLTVVATRARRHWAQAVGIACVVAAGVAVWSVTRVVGPVDGYLIAWVAALPLALGIGFVMLLAEGGWFAPLLARMGVAGDVRARTTAIAGRALAGAAVIGVVLLMSSEVSDLSSVPISGLTPPDAGRLQDEVSAALHRLPAGPVLLAVDDKTSDSWPVATGITVRLVQDGRPVMIEDKWLFLFGDQFARQGRRPTVEIDVVVPADAKPVAGRQGSSLVATGDAVQVYVVPASS